MWVLVAAIYLIVVIIIVSLTFPNPKSVGHWDSFYDKMRSESKQKLVYVKKPGVGKYRIVEGREEFMRVVTTPTVTVEMPNGHTLTFEAELPEKAREAVVQEYWNIVKAEVNRMRIRHLLINCLIMILT